MPYENPIEKNLYQREKRAERARKKELKPCGTPAAYERHRRKGEPIDDLCRRGRNEYFRKVQWKRRHPDGVKMALKDEARKIALERLAAAYPDAYLTIYKKALAEVQGKKK